MTSFSPQSLAGLPDLVGHLLTSAPVTRTKLLELSLRWSELTGVQAAMARELRVFVLTWDPLETSQPRPMAFGTTNAGPLEVVVYIPLSSLASAGEPVADVLGAVGGTAVLTAAAHAQDVRSGQYPHLVASGSAPDLLAGSERLGRPDQIKAVTGRWEDIGLGAITDIVQQACGPVDLDRSLVELSAAGVSDPGCPACAGERFGFIADLAEAAKLMCGPHRSEAESVQRRRLARAEDSNPDGWWTIGDACIRLSEPHLPNGLYTRMIGASSAADRAAVVIEAARWFPGQQASFLRALGEPDWLPRLIRELGAAGLPADAMRVAEALTGVNPALAPRYAGEVAVALANAGSVSADDARDRVLENVRRWPADFWVRLYAGEALEALGDSAEALAEYEQAQQIGTFGEKRQVAVRIRRLSGVAEPTVVRRPRRTGRRR